ncbi:hypothetical protein OnM2_070036 [Erysiphe neolycopersici]|uniref:Uncharacterized protein n=1 Tax=Erysiphe neolycopersici TaxID=212602 RepID=A0A420HKT8_9PEZI|nr:hypothetical protein OnM2_070036 [Erysiphe neolycopersici]
MGLVDYSDSDISENEQKNDENQNPLNSKSSKKSFEKVVDITNPKKIRISLPQLPTTEEENLNEPSNKKPKLEGIRGFNSLLPAPKRAASTTNVVSVVGDVSKKGLGSGVHLATGSIPVFSREANEETIFTSKRSNIDGQATGNSNHEELQNIKKDEKKINTLMFKPLSVSNKIQKQKKITSGSVSSSVMSTLDPSINKIISEKQPRILLFPLATVTEEQKLHSVNDNYQPMLYNVSNTPNKISDDRNIEVSHQENRAIPKLPLSSSLSSIADSLHLSDSERRQLFGRQKGNSKSATTTNIIDFNTDTEYLHNEEIRAAGEKIVNNPVRSIAPGKHSLKQLIHAAQSQKDALEESFAKGKSNRTEAGSRYGW